MDRIFLEYYEKFGGFPLVLFGADPNAEEFHDAMKMAIDRGEPITENDYKKGGLLGGMMEQVY